jgi:hypothetical protein
VLGEVIKDQIPGLLDQIGYPADVGPPRAEREAEIARLDREIEQLEAKELELMQAAESAGLQITPATQMSDDDDLEYLRTALLRIDGYDPRVMSALMEALFLDPPEPLTWKQDGTPSMLLFTSRGLYSPPASVVGTVCATHCLTKSVIQRPSVAVIASR